MYERMLDKRREAPTFAELIAYSGESGPLWTALDEYLRGEFGADRTVRFPYGKDYGWGAKYSKGKKHICDVFAEDGAFSVLFQVSGSAVESIYGELDDYAKGVWESRHPCGGGGWVDFRVLSKPHLESVVVMIAARMAKRAK